MSTDVSVSVPRSKALDGYAAAINAAHGRSVGLLFEIASNLKLAHDELANHGDGKFYDWVSANCTFSKSTCENYLRVLRVFEGKDCVTVTQSFDASALYYLSRDTTPEEATADAIKAAQAGERVTLKRAKEFAERYTVDAESDDESDEPEEWALFPCIKKLNRYALTLYERWPKEDIAAMVGKLRSIADEIEAGSFQGGEFIDDDVD